MFAARSPWGSDHDIIMAPFSGQISNIDSTHLKSVAQLGVEAAPSVKCGGKVGLHSVCLVAEIFVNYFSNSIIILLIFNNAYCKFLSLAILITLR